MYEILRNVTYAGIWGERERQHPGQWGRLVGENLRDAARFTIHDIGAAEVEFTRIYQRAQAFFAEHDLLTPADRGGQRMAQARDLPGEHRRPRGEELRRLGRHHVRDHVDQPSVHLDPVRRRRARHTVRAAASSRRAVATCSCCSAAMALESVLARDPRRRRPVPDLDVAGAQPADDPLGQPVA